MKVWINKASGGYVGGLAIVAARSSEEAHGVLLSENDSYKYMYEFQGWEEAPMLTADTDRPCFIAEDSHEG